MKNNTIFTSLLILQPKKSIVIALFTCLLSVNLVKADVSVEYDDPSVFLGDYAGYNSPSSRNENVGGPYKGLKVTTLYGQLEIK